MEECQRCNSKDLGEAYLGAFDLVIRCNDCLWSLETTTKNTHSYETINIEVSENIEFYCCYHYYLDKTEVIKYYNGENEEELGYINGKLKDFPKTSAQQINQHLKYLNF